MDCKYDPPTCYCQFQRHRTVWLFWGDQVTCGCCILAKHAWKRQSHDQFKPLSALLKAKRCSRVICSKADAETNLLDVVCLFVILPLLVQLVYFTCHISLLFEIKTLQERTILSLPHTQYILMIPWHTTGMVHPHWKWLKVIPTDSVVPNAVSPNGTSVAPPDHVFSTVTL